MKTLRCSTPKTMTFLLKQVRLIIGVAILDTLLCLGSAPSAGAQTPGPPITTSGLNTQISGPVAVGGMTQYNITGGTRPGGGTNIFHSFGEFNVPSGNIANFFNETAAPTTNILGRVTSGNPSSIFGTVQTEGFGNANLFLMNPAGIIFGPNATLNVGGAVTFTTANYLRLAEAGETNAGIFHVDAASTSLLTSAPVIAFGFLGPNPAAISVQGSTLNVTPGHSLSLIGGTHGFTYNNMNTGLSASVPDGVTVTSGTLASPGGQINLVSVASAGEVLYPGITYGPNINGAQFTNLGKVSLTEGSLVTVSAESAGTIRIRSGEFVVANSTVSADTGNADGAPIAIDIDVTGAVSLSHDSLPALTARTSETGNPGNILISSGSLNATFSSSSGIESLIDSHTMGSGHGGNIIITTGPLTMNGSPTAPGYFIDSGSGGDGNGGHVSITAGEAQFRSGGINTGDNTYFGVGSGGNLTIRADSLLLETVSLATDSFNARAGALSLETTGLLRIGGNSFVSNISLLGDNPITLRADHLIVEHNSKILAGTALNAGGDVNITARIVELRDGSTISTQTFGDGDAGNIHLTATESAHILDDHNSTSASGLYTTSVGTQEFGSLGNAGTITVDVPRLEMTNGGRINSTTLTAGRGGDVIITASDSVSIIGERPSDVSEEIFGLGGTRASGIYARTAGSELCAGTCGGAGHVTITTRSLTLQNGGVIDSGTTNNGQGGNTTILAADQVLFSGTMQDGTPSGIFSRTIGSTSDDASGGNIALTAGQSVTISNGAAVSASSTGPGNAGNVSIQGLTSPAQSVLIDGHGSGIFTDTQGTGAGGNISINANSLTLQNGGTLSAATSGTEASATGGTITVNASTITLDNQATISASTTGAGNAGTITLQADNKLALLGNSSLLNSTDSSGHGGFVLLHAPTIEMQNQSNIVASTAGSGNAGEVTLEAGQVQMSSNSFVAARTQSEGHGGDITIRGITGDGSSASTVTLSGGSQLVTETIGDGVNVQGPAGNIRVDTAQLSITGGSLLNSSSRGSTAAAGNISINASDSILISGAGSGLLSESVEFSFGDAGNIFMKAPSIVISDQAAVSTKTSLFGNAGTITAQTNNLQLQSGGTITSSSVVEFADFLPTGAAGNITIEGLASPAQSVLIDGPGSGIFTDTQGTGAGGNININANSVRLQNGGLLSAATSGTAPSASGGTITVNANQVQLNNGGLITAASTGSGAGGSITIGAESTFASSASTVNSTASQAQGGDITITAGNSVTLANSSLVSASSTGPGNAGNILINAGQNYTSTDSAVTTQATAPGTNASGGNITVLASDQVRLTNSQLNASVQGSSTTVGGNIVIDPTYVILQNSQIIAQAFQGQGGNISITTNFFLPDSVSIVNASSQFGVNGTVNIQSPLSQLGGKLSPLPKNSLESTTWINSRCRALAGGQASSFVVAGRDMLPAEPGGWLGSPVTGLTGEPVFSTHVPSFPQIHKAPSQEDTVSLRRMTPPGFLLQAFATDRLADCTS